jgi:hypothetical protein
MKVEHSDTSYFAFNTFAKASFTVGDTKELLPAEHTPILREPTTTYGFVADHTYGRRQSRPQGYSRASVEIPHSHRLHPRSAEHPDGHSDQFPAPPRAWECCGCKQKFYNFEKQCDFCATLHCKDCKKIPWK